MLWILIAPVLVLLILFGLSNRAEVALHLWPFDLSWVAPLSVAILVPAAIAFLFGATIAWLAAMPYRRRNRQLDDSRQALAAEVAELRARLAREVGPAPVPAGKSSGTSVVALRRSAA
jgi:uncharacterized integral membrane protein